MPPEAVENWRPLPPTVSTYKPRCPPESSTFIPGILFIKSQHVISLFSLLPFRDLSCTAHPIGLLRSPVAKAGGSLYRGARAKDIYGISIHLELTFFFILPRGSTKRMLVWTISSTWSFRRWVLLQSRFEHTTHHSNRSHGYPVSRSSHHGLMAAISQ